MNERFVAVSIRLRGLGNVVAFLSRDVMSVLRGVATDDECTPHSHGRRSRV